MKTVERTAILLLVIATIGDATAPAHGAGGTSLTCVAEPTDPDYGAVGLVKFRDVQSAVDRDYNTWYSATLIVTCSDLTPRAEYEVWCLDWYSDHWELLGSFPADKNGRGSAQGPFAWVNALFVEVRRIDQTPTGPIGMAVLNGWVRP